MFAALVFANAPQPSRARVGGLVRQGRANFPHGVLSVVLCVRVRVFICETTDRTTGRRDRINNARSRPLLNNRP